MKMREVGKLASVRRSGPDRGDRCLFTFLSSRRDFTSPIGGPNKKKYKKEGAQTVRCASPIFKPIAYYLSFTNRKRKYVEEKTTTKLKINSNPCGY
jgi:hypothetical protein